MSQNLRFDTSIGPLGAVVQGIDLSASIAPADWNSVKTAWLAHKVLVFRDQVLTPAQQASVAARLGELDVYPYVTALAAHPNVVPIIKEAHETLNFGGGWHIDTSYLERPPMATVLYAVDTPENGGDTLFADAAAAFEDLSAGLKRWLSSLTGIYSAREVHAPGGAYAHLAQNGRGSERSTRDFTEIEHPLIRTHPETGARSIFCTPAHTVCFKGMTREESLPVLQYLQEHVTQAQYVTRVRWRPGTLVIWDNRTVFHHALNDYQGQRREMRRVIVKGDRPG